MRKIVGLVAGAVLVVTALGAAPEAAAKPTPTKKKKLPSIVACTGFEWLSNSTTAGMSSGDAGNKVFDAATDHDFLGANGGRAGTNTGWVPKFVSSASAKYLRWSAATFGTTSVIVSSIWLRVDSGIGTPIIFHTEAANASRVNLQYDPSTGQLALVMPGESSQAATITVATGTWFRLDIRVDYSGTRYVADWQITPYSTNVSVPQQQLVSAAGKTGTTVAHIGPGDTSAQTVTWLPDDWVIATNSGDYPLGDYNVYLLDVDLQVGEHLVSGTVSNWWVYNDDPTGTGWVWFQPEEGSSGANYYLSNYGTAGDGLVQKVASATDFMNIKMFAGFVLLDYPTTVGQVVVGARLIFLGIAGDTTGSNIEVRVWNGTSEWVAFPLGDPHFLDRATASAGTQVSIARMIPVDMVNSKDKLDNLSVRYGGSTDATPWIGADRILIEMAIHPPAA